MTGRHKAFVSGPRAKDPITFSLDGEEFSARPSLPGITLMEFTSEAGSDDPVRVSEAVIDFFNVALVEEDLERFRDMIRDPDRPIEMETLGEVLSWLVEQMSTRPTSQPIPSRSGRKSTGRGSTGSTSTVEQT